MACKVARRSLCGRQYRTKSVWRLCTPSACKFPVIFHKNAREYIKYSLRFLFHLTKNLTTHLSHNLCAVLPALVQAGFQGGCHYWSGRDEQDRTGGDHGAVRPNIETIKVKVRGKASLEKFIAHVKKEYPQVNVYAVDTIEEAVRDADIVSASTSTPTGCSQLYPVHQRGMDQAGCTDQFHGGSPV